MGLLQNQTIFNQYPFRLTGAGAFHGFSGHWPRYSKKNIQNALGPLTAVPTGYLGLGAWTQPKKAGAISSFNECSIEITGNLTNAAQGIPFSASASFEISGNSCVVSALAFGSGTATITFTTSASATAPIFASGTSSFTITGNNLPITAPAFTSGTSSFAITGNVLPTFAIGYMIAGPISDALTPDSIAAAVWSSLASSNNLPGTMGEKLNDAGSASNPWTEIIEGSHTAGDILRYTVSVLAGKSIISGSTVYFRDLGDSKNRITATISSSQRTSVILDGTP